MFKSIDINFNFNTWGKTTSITFDIPKFSKILDIDIFENSLLKIFYESNVDLLELKPVYLKLIHIDNTTTISEPMIGYEFFKTITSNNMDLISNGRILTQEFISEKYLLFIDYNMGVDEIRDDRLNQIL